VDRGIVERARDGDHAAFAVVAEASIGHLTAVARLILRDEERAQDAVQDALIAAWKGIRSLRDPDRLDAWLHRLLVRACYAHAGRGRIHHVTEIAFPDGLDLGGPDEHRTVERRDELERGMRRLSAGQRAVLVATYYLDLPAPEAADMLGIPVGTLKSRLNRALQGLRGAIEADSRPASDTRERYA
jgi:RNA polymerase sigma-70 factor, ECF subfamily